MSTPLVSSTLSSLDGLSASIFRPKTWTCQTEGPGVKNRIRNNKEISIRVKSFRVS